MAVPTLTTRIKHAVLGCRPINHHVVNMNAKRLVMVGKICPICFREYPG